MAITQRQQFLGMDKDTEPGFMQPGMYQYALNCHVGSSERGNIGSVENVKGNTLVSFSLPAGENKCIGTHEDIQNSRVIYFIWNSNNLHGIYEFNGLDITISNLFESSILNFQVDYIITGIGLVNNILSWCDNYNPNRLIDLNNLASYSTPYSEEMISLIKKPPTYPPIVVRKNDVSYTRNNIKKRYFQFALRYIYKDNTKSVISPYSKLSKNTLIYSSVNKGPFETTSGFSQYVTIESTTPDNNNYIEIYLNNSEAVVNPLASIIKSIDILYKEGNEEAWGLFKTVKISEAISASGIFKFYNDSPKNTLDQVEILRQFDSVPLKSGTHEVVKNRGFWGNNTEGYDLGTDLNIIPLPHYLPKSYTGFTPRPNPALTVGLTLYKDQGVYKFGVLWKDKYGRHVGIDTRDNFSTNINASSLLSGAYINKPSICDYINLQLSGTPPDWAHSYSIVRSKNLNQGYYQQIGIKKVQYLIGYDSLGVAQYIDSYSEAKGVIETHITYNAGAYTNTPYVFEEGDYLRLWRNLSTTPEMITCKIKGVYYGSEDVTLPERGGDGSLDIIAKFEQQGIAKIIIEGTNLNQIDFMSTGEVFNYVINDGFYYEIGETYPVTNPETPSRSLSVTNINSYGGDCYLIVRPLYSYESIGLKRYTFFYIEAPNLFDDFFQVNQTDIGSPTIVIPDVKHETKNCSIRFSDLYIQNSNLNGISSFQGLNEYNLPYEYGPISKLQIASNTESDGSVLLSIHSHETVSLYIGEVVYSDVAGKNTIGVSNDVIGSARALRGSYGTMNPESVVQHNGSVYGWDVLKGIVWRYASDGLNPISNLKMKNFFYQKSRDKINIENSRAFATFDRCYNEYIISFNEDTLAFNEVENRWVTFYSFIPEFYQKINTKIVSFIEGELWIHDSNSTHNNFYGLQYNSKISPVCNIEPMNTKILLNISTSSQDKWVGIEIINPAGQECNLVEGDYIKNETGFSANVLRDRNTPNIELPQIPALHGDLMRDYSFTTLLECTATESSILRFANFSVIPSENNN